MRFPRVTPAVIVVEAFQASDRSFVRRCQPAAVDCGGGVSFEAFQTSHWSFGAGRRCLLAFTAWLLRLRSLQASRLDTLIIE